MGNTILSLNNINKSFGPIDVLHDISLEVKEGEVLCLLGDNGAGKSTAIRLLSEPHRVCRRPNSPCYATISSVFKFA